MLLKKFLKFRHAAIKRYGEKRWTVAAGFIEFNPNYTVSCGSCEKGQFGDLEEKPYIVELSNGTKFLCFLYKYGDCPTDEILSEEGESANNCCRDNEAEIMAAVKRNIYQLNS